MFKLKKSKIGAAIALSLMLSASSSAFAANVTSTADVNVRSGPGMSYGAFTVMKKVQARQAWERLVGGQKLLSMEKLDLFHLSIYSFQIKTFLRTHLPRLSVLPRRR